MDSSKGIVASNYSPACLPLLLKWFTWIFAESIYDHLKGNILLPDEQKRCRRGPEEQKDKLLIDKVILVESKKRRRNMTMAWVDYKNAYGTWNGVWYGEVCGVDNE